MTMHAYQQEVLRTLAGTEQRAIAETGLSQENIALLTVFSLGVTGEAGEVADIVKKVVGHGHPLDRAALDGCRPLEFAIREAMRNHGPDLGAVSALTSWPTPAAS